MSRARAGNAGARDLGPSAARPALSCDFGSDPAGSARDALDLLIVGAGPCGLAVGVAAKERGLRYLVLDKGTVAHSLIGYPYYMTFFSTAERLEIGGVPFAIPDPKPTRREALAYYRRVVRHHALAVRQYEEVAEIEEVGAAASLPSPCFRVRSVCRRRGGRGEARLYAARAVAIATGGFGEPNRLDFPGGQNPSADGRIVHYYREPYPYFEQDVIVVGGGNSAVEAALELHRNGVRVRMVHFGAAFDRGVKPWVRPDIDNRIAAGEIPMHWRSRIAAVGPDTAAVTNQDTGATAEHSADWILAMTGWRADHALLHALGVRTDPRTGVPAHDPATMETNIRGAYVAGVIAAGFDANKIFIENGREHGARIAAAVYGASAAPDASSVSPGAPASLGDNASTPTGAPSPSPSRKAAGGSTSLRT